MFFSGGKLEKNSRLRPVLFAWFYCRPTFDSDFVCRPRVALPFFAWCCCLTACSMTPVLDLFCFIAVFVKSIILAKRKKDKFGVAWRGLPGYVVFVFGVCFLLCDFVGWAYSRNMTEKRGKPHGRREGPLIAGCNFGSQLPLVIGPLLFLFLWLGRSLGRRGRR